MRKVLLLLFLLLSFIGFSTKEEEQELINKSNKALTELERILALIELNDFYESSDYFKWLEGKQNLERFYAKLPNTELKNKVGITLAKYAFNLGNTTSFKRYLNDFKFGNHPMDQLTLTEFNSLKINSYLLIANYEDAKKLAIQNLLIAKQSRKNKYVSASYSSLARIYVLQNNQDSAYISASYATSFAKRSDSKQQLFKALHHQAAIFASFENYEAAVNKELQVLQLAEDYKNFYFQTIAYQGVALYSMQIKNLDEAITYLKRSKDLNISLKDLRINAINNLIEAGIYVNKGQFNNGLALIQVTEPYFKKNNDENNLGHCKLLRGIIQLKMKQFKASLRSFNLALNYYQVSGDLIKLTMVNQFIGETYLMENKLEKAENYLLLALAENELSGLKSVKIQSTYKLLSQLYFKKNELRKAIKYQFLCLEFLESNTILNSAAAVARMTEGNLREERERLIEFQKESIERQDKEKEIKSLQLSRQLFIGGIIIGLMIVGFVFYILRLRQEKLKQKQREIELSQSLLRTQMNPHFIFNAMSVIQSYIYSNEPDKSSQFLVNFSRLIRLILENSPKEFIPIELEIEILEKYLQAQKMRFENRFSYTLEIDESLITDCAMVPPMITQPFVENAIEHGQLHTIDNGHITIRISQVNNMIQIQISDNGVGRKGAQKTKKIKSHKSMAINITKERIEIINFKYKKQGSIQMDDLDKKKQTGTVVTILLPLHIDTD
jgi:tetratricopeptide (TPR) repeat protein